MKYKGIDLESSPKVKKQKKYLDLLTEDRFITRKEYETFENQSKSNDFRYSIELYKQLISEGKYSVALPIICSLIDDRENRLLYYIIKKEKGNLEWENNLDSISYLQLSMLHWKIKTNLIDVVIGRDFATEHHQLKMLRAELIHLLVFNLNEERAKRMCEMYMNHFRILDQHVKKFKKG